ncbi:DAK2 domain-containing protein [Acidiferrimicrobium sp. IK]|uniref:DAK2 domain-containing protein n=1 Tax=Acidiferrimicrobium sp. IK TaxID=2871700 RepID=UPI0021CB1291|nr:DAK2 domain-containing protein [Acidiferrimicrobium sp. IK]MCU4183794.1 DAK2 domain-containing protein [Acidiferrimicrobium sp. IK]
MQTLERLAAGDLVAIVTAYRDALRAHQEIINRLNVYPVPDGDTGTNMALTLESVVAEVAERGDGDLTVVAKAISHGSLMGARGNSGVILSQILRGLASTFGAAGSIDGPVWRDALSAARQGAYKAVQHPVEGTILSVMAAADDAVHAAASDDLLELADLARSASYEALARTPEQLPVLAKAGVVDSGGSGLVLLFDAVCHVVGGRPLPEPDTSVPGAAAPAAESSPDEPAGDDGPDDLRYEVMYLLEAPDATIDSFRDVWAGIGDSIVVVGGDGLYNCHIHTADIGAAIEAALEVGRPRKIRVTDLWEEVEEERWVREAAAGTHVDPPVEPVECAVVAVCTGDGIRRIFHSLGVTTTVTGGQTMNPSTAELLDAIAKAPAEQVIILPNNKNIVPVAEAAAAQASKAVRVVATRGIPEGFAALLEYDPEGDVDANAELMTISAGRVVAGEVTTAVRDTESEVGAVRAGDYIGLSRRGIEAVGATASEAAIALLDRLIDDAHHEIATLIVGEGAAAAETRRITEWMAEHRPEMTAEIHQGGQPLYPYLFSIE